MSIVLEKLQKRYENHIVVNNVSLEVKDGEFFVLLGSSGSGKTTILNLIAGLTPLESGNIVLNSRDVTGLPTQKRSVGFVFQDYALFQYMTVAENVEFALSIRKVPMLERQNRRDELLEIVGLAGLGDRMPKQLSGGQQQRVALARALAHKPDVLLLDEPLGALDAKIRIELRRSLKNIQRQLGIATILVTHDQEEAFDLADRIGVMSYGRLVEVGTPSELYRQPRTEFVATFLGTANLLVGRVNGAHICMGQILFPYEIDPAIKKSGKRVQVLFRPEEVALSPNPEGLNCPNMGLATVEETGFSGAYERLRLQLSPIPGVRAISPAVPYGSDSILIDATRPPDQALGFPLTCGDLTYVGVRRIHAIAHPGLNFLVLSDSSMKARYALELAGQVGRLANARVTLLRYSSQVNKAFEEQDGKNLLGTGLVSLQVVDAQGTPDRMVRGLIEKQPYDMVIMGFRAEEDRELAEYLLRTSQNHLLLVPSPQASPTRALICVSPGEPGKDDILFAGRLIRHLGADATLMTVFSDREVEPKAKSRIDKFLEDGIRTLGVLGVPAKTEIRHGEVVEEIIKEIETAGYDLLVLGAPLAPKRGEMKLEGIVWDVIQRLPDHPILIVRSTYVGS
jgi:sulfate/thiosulfate transport system ATP-binding protein